MNILFGNKRVWKRNNKNTKPFAKGNTLHEGLKKVPLNILLATVAASLNRFLILLPNRS